jgi:hypothetical protein
MSSYAHLSPHPKFQLPSQRKYGGPRAVDNLVEEVTEYIRHGGGTKNPFEQNLIGELELWSCEVSSSPPHS